jgi:hypothetical protein
MTFVSRAEWGAGSVRSQRRMTSPAPRVFLHHTVTATSPATSIVRSIEDVHVRRFGVGPGYSFLIEVANGIVYEGQGWGRVGAHTHNNNSTSHGIAFIGDFQERSLPAVARRAAVDLIVDGVRLGHIAAGPHIGPHSDVSQTACPGDRVRSEIPTIRALVADALRNSPTPPPEEDDMPARCAVIDPKASADRHGRVAHWQVAYRTGAIRALNGARDLHPQDWADFAAFRDASRLEVVDAVYDTAADKLVYAFDDLVDPDGPGQPYTSATFAFRLQPRT